MSDQKKSTNQKNGSPLVFILIMLGLGFTGCNDESKTGTNTTVETTDTSGKANAGALSVGNFSILKLKKADLATLFTDNGTQKILLQFLDDNTTSNVTPIKLIAYGATNTNRKTSGPVILEMVPGQNPINFSGTKYLGNLEVTRKSINDILGITGNPPINLGNAKDLFFEPTQPTGPPYANYVLYYIGLKYPIDKTTITLPPPTNPSPPADPCNPCQ